ncbi:MAG: serine/threonine-protein kinase [Planctomycetota bacterium]
MDEQKPEDLVGKKFGRYTITALLGKGGMSAVYLAEDSMIGRKVALKVLDAAHASDEFVQRFYQEVRLTARLKHPNIVALHDAGEQNGLHYMALEYVEGRALQESASKGDKPSVLVVLRIMAAIAGALQHAHEQQIIHKDIKPANIQIGPTGVPMLMDFGLSAPTSGDPMLASGMVVGTPHYISPEQARGDDTVGPATDIWSFGATMFHILAGRTPYLGKTAAAIMLQVASSDPVDLSPLHGRAPEYVIAIIAKCLRKKPEERYRSADEIRRALETAIDHLESTETSETIVVAPPRPGQTVLLHVEYQEAGLPGSYREYEISSRIGGGAFGDVYSAQEKLSGKTVALKVLKHEWLADKEAVARFRREATLFSRLSHPNVLRVHNFGRYGASFFMAMDLLDGPTLEKIRRERGTLPLDEALRHTRAILRGLEAIHSAGIVHRDLKPANVAFMQEHIVIFDFGLARVTDMTRLTLSGEFRGTAQYASPEQARGEAVTSASDVYAAGVILYELLTGKIPHEAESVFGLLHKKAAEPPVPITAHRGDLPEAVVRMLNVLLETNPEKRPTATAAIRMLNTYLIG